MTIDPTFATPAAHVALPEAPESPKKVKEASPLRERSMSPTQEHVELQEAHAHEQSAAANEVLTEEPPRIVGRSTRERKQVQRLSLATEGLAQEKKLHVPSGSGVKLGDIPYVEDQLKRHTGMDETLRSLHRILYPGHPVSKKDVKANLRLFCGLSDSEEQQVSAMKERFGKWMLSGLKEVCGLFALERSGTKEVVIQRIVEYLKKPTNLGKMPVSEKLKKKRISSKKQQKKKAVQVKQQKKGSKDVSESDLSSDDNDEEDEQPQPKKAKLLSEAIVESSSEDEDDVRPLSALQVPAKDALKAEVHRIVKTSDLNELSKRKVRNLLKEKFGHAVSQSMNEEEAQQWWESIKEEVNGWIDVSVSTQSSE